MQGFLFREENSSRGSGLHRCSKSKPVPGQRQAAINQLEISCGPRPRNPASNPAIQLGGTSTPMLNTAEVLGTDVGPTLHIGAFIGIYHDLPKPHMHPELKTVAPAINCMKSKAGKGLHLHDHPDKQSFPRSPSGQLSEMLDFLFR